MSEPTGSSTISSLNRLIAHVRTPLYRNGYALILSSATTSGIGLLYWILAAHLYPTDAVGLNSALVSTMMFLAGVSQLNLMSALIRFVPVTGRATGRFVKYIYIISLSVAALTSLVFVLGTPVWAPKLS